MAQFVLSIRICKTLLAGRTWRDYEQVVILSVILGSLACLSFALLIWQWLVARRFPLHQRVSDKSFAPAVTVFKPLKGADAHTEKCLRSWFTQEYAGPIQILLGVQSAADTAVPVINKLIAEFPSSDARLVLTSGELGTNGKVSNLAQLVSHAKHDVFVISDADVLAPPDFLANAVFSLSPRGTSGERVGVRGSLENQTSSPRPSPPLREAREKDGGARGGTRPTNAVGLVNCFYRLANPTTLAMQWEAIAVNADFWSQVLQSKSLKPLDFALGAVMVTRRKNLDEIGGFEALADCLADDYQLGHRIAARGHEIYISPVVVECWDPPQTWTSVWKHQLRWARTVRVCQPVPYFFSILSNPTLWPLVWFIFAPNGLSAGFCAWMFIVRALVAENLMHRLMQNPGGLVPALAPLKDLLQFLVWLCAFAGNRIEWRGKRFHLRKDGTLVKIEP